MTAHGPTLPDHPEAVTATWLTESLQPSLPGIEVVATEILDQHSGTTGRMRLRLHLGAGVDGPESVFIKLPPFEETQRRMVAATDMGRREARFYAGPAAEVDLRVPRAYAALAGEEPTDYIIVLEDLVAEGAEFTSRLEPHTAEESQQLIESLGRMHAHFWEDTRFDGELAWLKPSMRGSYGAKLVDKARERFGAEMPPVFTELCQLYIEHHERINQVWDIGEQTLVHGDTHVGNHFVIDGRVGLYDWAVISRSPGIRDIAIYLGNSCPTEVRREYQDRWLDAYRDALVDGGAEAPSLADLWTRFRTTVLYSWIAATTTAAMGSRWQPAEVGMVGMTRATETCADVDTIGAIRELL